jgi:hypothetical protein
MTPEEKQKDIDSRLTQFREGLEKLKADTLIGIRAQIMPDGPLMSMVDMKEYEEVPVVQEK